MPPSKCPGCQRVFEDPRGFANHKRRCRKVKGATARRLLQYRARSIQIPTQALQTGDGSLHMEEGRAGPVSIAVDGMHLVRLDPLLALVLSHLNAIRTKFPAPQPPSCVHLADLIERSAFLSAIRITFPRILLLCLTRHITSILANLVMMRTSFSETLKTYSNLHFLPLSHLHRHIALVLIPMGSIEYIQTATHRIPQMKSIH